MFTLADAYTVATLYHKRQLDKAGRDYMEHLWDVSQRCSSERGKILAFIHDVGEVLLANDWELDVMYCDLEVRGVNDIAEAFLLVTRRKDQTYKEYIEALANNDLAKEVKIADLQSNLSPERAAGLVGTDLRPRYESALRYLQTGEW